MSFENLLQKNKKTYLMLTAILIVGIFLRSYHFAQWLRFNDDQARDARLAASFTANHVWPLWGPRAAETDFKLGPVYYYFQHGAALLWGASPVSIAFPDLIFALLTIPLLYFFVKKYFEEKIALWLAGLFATAYFVVYYSRFAWNPNSVPFFALVFLYALLELLSEKKNKKYFWAVACGIALGIGVQLHTVFLIVAPALLMIIFAYALKHKMLNLKLVLTVLVVAIILNAPQIYSEITTHGKNTKAFFAGSTKEAVKSKSVTQNMLEDVSCNARENAMIISSLGQTVQCSSLGVINPLARIKSGNMSALAALEWLGGFLAVSTFSLGGYFLWGYFLKQESNSERKNFLIVTGAYALIAFLMLLPLAFGIPERFFLVLEFVPFILLGLWLQFLQTKFLNLGKICVTAMMLLLFSVNLNSNLQAAEHFSGQNLQNITTPQEVTLSETQFFANFMVAHAGAHKSINFLDESGELFGMSRSLAYFTVNANIEVQPVIVLRPLQNNDPLFVLNLAEQKPSWDGLGNYVQSGSVSFGRFTLYQMVKTNF